MMMSSFLRIPSPCWKILAIPEWLHPPANQALDILRQQDSVDLVITDYAMPKMTGLQLSAAIKKEWPKLPVVIATGFAEMDAEMGSSVTKLAKPFTQAELARTLAGITSKMRRGGRLLKFPVG